MISYSKSYSRPLKGLLALLVLAALSGCESVNFYSQAMVGQSRLLLARTSTSELLESRTTDPALRDRILFVNEVLSFADELGLTHGGSYQHYVETGQPYVIWNVFAAKPYRLELKQSCFPVAGCVSYRGYFQKQQALRGAARLSEQGYEVYVGGVTAYSTLGWFDDPLLDTFLFQSDERLAALLFHELAHRVIYVPGDTRFNESLATTIERYALQQWFESRQVEGALTRWQQERDRRDEVIRLINSARASLVELYSSGLSEHAMAEAKRHVIETLKADHQLLAADWQVQGETLPFAAWMKGEINNAKLETVADYYDWVPGLNRLIDEMGMAQFFGQLDAMAAMSFEDREQLLQGLQR